LKNPTEKVNIRIVKDKKDKEKEKEIKSEKERTMYINYPNINDNNRIEASSKLKSMNKSSTKSDGKNSKTDIAKIISTHDNFRRITSFKESAVTPEQSLADQLLEEQKKKLQNLNFPKKQKHQIGLEKMATT